MERKIYLYDRGFWVLFRMLGIFAADLVLYYVDSRVGIPAGDFCRHCGNCCAPDAQPMHKAAVCGTCRWAVDRREAFGQVEKTFPLDAFPYAYLYTDAKYWETVVLSKKPLTAGRIRGLFQLNLANRRNDIVRIPCSFTKQGGEIRAYFAGVYALEEVR